VGVVQQPRLFDHELAYAPAVGLVADDLHPLNLQSRHECAGHLPPA
jgi:hypothetical protein